MRRCHISNFDKGFDERFNSSATALHSCSWSSGTKYKSPIRSVINFVSPSFSITVARNFINNMSQFLSIIFVTGIKCARRSGTWSTLLKLTFLFLPLTLAESKTVPFAIISIEELLIRFNLPRFESFSIAHRLTSFAFFAKGREFSPFFSAVFSSDSPVCGHMHQFTASMTAKFKLPFLSRFAISRRIFVSIPAFLCKHRVLHYTACFVFTSVTFLDNFHTNYFRCGQFVARLDRTPKIFKCRWQATSPSTASGFTISLLT